MKKIIVALSAFVLGAVLVLEHADAASRLGGGRSLGAQRQSVAPQKPGTPPSQQAAQPAPAQPAPAGAGRWLGPLAGLAAGLGLGWLFSQSGFGGVIGAILMALLAGVAVMALLRLIARPRPDDEPQARYAGLDNGTIKAGTIAAGTITAPPPSQLPGAAGTQPSYRTRIGSNIPAGFDADGFLREAKRNFIRLQEVNDRSDIERLREVTTAEMFEELKGEFAARAGAQQTDVVSLEAALLNVATENGLHWASVRFSGSIREQAQALAEPFEETWHLQKPGDGSSGWLLAGIQQAA
jgi:predicted lipid-binding transport protein (Tim44 family)